MSSLQSLHPFSLKRSVVLQPSPRSSLSCRCHLQQGTCHCCAFRSVASVRPIRQASSTSSQATIRTSDAHVFRASRNNRNRIINRAVVSMSCGENGIAHVQVIDCKSRVRGAQDENLHITRLFTKTSQRTVSPCQIIPSSATSHQDVHCHWFLDLTLCVCPCSVLFLDSSFLFLSPSLGRRPLTDVSLLGVSFKLSLLSHVLLFKPTMCLVEPIPMTTPAISSLFVPGKLITKSLVYFPFTFRVSLYFVISTNHRWCYTSRWRSFTSLLNSLIVSQFSSISS